MMWRDHSVTVTVPAWWVKNAVSLAKGFTMSGGVYLSRSVLSDLDVALDDVGYENYMDDPFPEAFDWKVR